LSLESVITGLVNCLSIVDLIELGIIVLNQSERKMEPRTIPLERKLG